MKDLILQALNNAFEALEKRVPQTKKKNIYISIQDVKPTDIISFMIKNNIPDTAEFGGKPNGYDSFDEVCLCYDVDIPTTEKDKLDFKRRIFNGSSFRYVFNILTQNGYKRVGCMSNLFKEFQDTTAYDMYVNKDLARLEKYYSLSFQKI